ncbi:hypothetical protein MLD38_006434 [Melastoma candidum]|uniref:Uncharacterized protein n=1 Tax=Melastoma candidum TaxID=119954 RepID=A0ACB9RMH6_9MYRT|nr:hypothetical protein MLD38_006434 [Melastoma candidum]
MIVQLRRSFFSHRVMSQCGQLFYPSVASICSSSGGNDLLRRSSELTFRIQRIRPSSIVSGTTKFSRESFLGSSLIIPTRSFPTSNLSVSSIDCSARLRCAGCSGISCRPLSAVSGKDGVSLTDNKTPFKKGYSKKWKQAKALNVQSAEKGCPMVVSASRNGDNAVNGEASVNGTAVAELTSLFESLPARDKQAKAKGKRVQGKKKKEQKHVPGSSKDVVKSTSSSTSSQENRAAKVKNDSISLPELEDTPVSPKKRTNKKAENSTRKGKAGKATAESRAGQKSAEVVRVKTPGRKIQTQLYPPKGRSVLVVESVTKARVIQGYLGDMFEVLPSYGHVRDLAARSGSVRPDDDFSMVWEVPSPAWTHLKSIKVALNGADNLILASDPDREGEAIAWHIIEMLQQQDALPEDITVARVVFNEITESSIKAALQAPREIDVNLVHAYLARRALDYLIGFNISPLLWRKLPGCQSAGRVQSAALSLICDREIEIDQFRAQEYWSIAVEFEKRHVGGLEKSLSLSSQLTYFLNKKLGQFSISSLAEAEDIKQKIESMNFVVVGTKSNKTRRNPPTPYITSTLQQDAANKLNFSATYAMKLAQKLYEGVELSDGKAVGLITYIRTDGLHISDEAVKGIHSLVIDRYGLDYATETPRKYFRKVKNAQEAHEAIRPTDIRRLPSMLAGVLDEDLLKLYTLIWSRTMACQMVPAIVDQIHVDIGTADSSIVCGTSCSRVGFLGYQAVFKDAETEVVRSKDSEGNERATIFEALSSLKPGDVLDFTDVQLRQHSTQPPPRYSEGALVKKLEELGIGRPSTYASILKVLQDRNYVTLKSRVLHPEFRGRMVSAFLAHHFSEVTDYCFTADMETELDNVSAGLTEWKGLLKDYWTRFSSYCERAASVHIHQVEKMLEKTFGDFLFASLPDKTRTCPSCMEGTLIFKVSRFGAGYFIGCDKHPKCKYIAKTLYGEEEDDPTPQSNTAIEEPKLLGVHPVSDEKVFLKNGPYGAYVQLGEDRKGYVPKRASVSQTKDVHLITLEDALDLLRYPITLGNHPKDGQPVVLKLAKVGFTIRHRRTIASVPKNVKPNDITLEKALDLLSGDDVRRCGRPKNKPKVEEEALEMM